jgi:two-component system C4-dicarboxylate transport response regulator DctD
MSQSPRAEGRRIVLGEGDPEVRCRLAAALVTAGHDVVDVEDGVAVLELFGDTTWSPDAVVVDARSPQLTGLDVLAELHDAVPPVPVILLAEPPLREVRVEGRRLGAFAVLERPVDPELLVEVVRRATRGAFSIPRPISLAARESDAHGRMGEAS